MARENFIARKKASGYGYWKDDDLEESVDDWDVGDI